MTPKPTFLGGTVSGRLTKRHPELQETYPMMRGYSKSEGQLALLDYQIQSSQFVWFDEAHHIKEPIDPDRDEKRDPATTKSWVMNHLNEAIPVKGAENPPSKAKRAALRAKRKKRK